MTQVQTWMMKYDEDIEEMDLKIQVKKNEYELELEKRISIEETVSFTYRFNYYDAIRPETFPRFSTLAIHDVGVHNLLQ